MFFLLRRRSPKLMVLQLVLLGVLLAVTFVFHVSGTALVEIRIARLVLVAAMVVGLRLIQRRRKLQSIRRSG